jgi:hypothetical protein
MRQVTSAESGQRIRKAERPALEDRGAAGVELVDDLGRFIRMILRRPMNPGYRPSFSLIGRLHFALKNLACKPAVGDLAKRSGAYCADALRSAATWAASMLEGRDPNLAVT